MTSLRFKPLMCCKAHLGKYSSLCAVHGTGAWQADGVIHDTACGWEQCVILCCWVSPWEPLFGQQLLWEQERLHTASAAKVCAQMTAKSTKAAYPSSQQYKRKSQIRTYRKKVNQKLISTMPYAVKGFKWGITWIYVCDWSLYNSKKGSFTPRAQVTETVK